MCITPCTHHAVVPLSHNHKTFTFQYIWITARQWRLAESRHHHPDHRRYRRRQAASRLATTGSLQQSALCVPSWAQHTRRAAREEAQDHGMACLEASKCVFVLGSRVSL